MTTLSRYQTTEHGTDIESAIRGFSQGNPAELLDMTVEEIEFAWVNGGEELTWSGEDILAVAHEMVENR